MGEGGMPEATTNKWRGPTMPRTNQLREGRNKRQRHWLRGRSRQTGNTTTNDQVGGDGAGGSQACEMGEGGRPEATTNKWRGPTMPHNNQQTERCNERQRHWLRGRGRQMGNTTTKDQVGGNGVVAIKSRGAD